MRERTQDADQRYCALLCCTWTGTHCGMTHFSGIEWGYCGMTVDYKLNVLRREHGGTRSQTWFAEYAAKLQATGGAG